MLHRIIPTQGTILYKAIDLNHKNAKTKNKHRIIQSFISLHYYRETPVHFNILHDLSKPFYYTQEVLIDLNSYEVAISAVRLRSWKAFDPIEIDQCHGTQIYDPTTEQCADYPGRKPKCRVKLRKKNSSNNCTGDREGDICEVTCLPGYTPQETSTVSTHVDILYIYRTHSLIDTS